MKLKIALLSLLFAVVTSFTAIHQAEHVVHKDASSCLVCTINQNILSGDAVSFVKNVELFHFEAALKESLFSYLHVQIDLNRTRAPPTLS